MPYLNARTIRLLDHPKTVNQIAALERRTARGARDSIDHPRDQHDDLANAIAGLAFATAQRNRGPGIFLGSYEDPARGYREHLEAQRAPYIINPQCPPARSLSARADRAAWRWFHRARIWKSQHEE